MKHLLTAILLFGIFSCTKEKMDSPEQYESMTLLGKTEIKVNSYTEPYSSDILNTCDNEMVHLSGIVKYTLRESWSQRRYTQYYEIDFREVTGLSTSGLKYTGGGISVAHVSTSLVNPATNSYNIYRMKFTAPGGHILKYTQYARCVITPQGVTMIDINNISDQCQ